MQKRKRRLSRLIKKASQSLRPQAQRSPIIFFGDMCGEEILLGLQTHAPSAMGGRRVRCSQAANLFVKK